MRLSVVGLGKLGLCTAASFARGGFKVLGLDSDPDVISILRAGGCHLREPGLAELIEHTRDRLAFSPDMAQLVSESDITFIVVPTPSRSDASFSNQYLVKVMEAMVPHLAAKQGFHVVAVVSTVMPGSCRQVFIPLLEKATGKLCGRDFGLAYNPEFVALGSVLRDFQQPDLVLIGASDQRGAEMVAEVHRRTVRNRPYFAEMSLVNAEIAKLALNCFVTTKISFANELAAICEQVEGADVDKVTAAIGADSRIGTKYLKGGLGFAGPCFPRDNQAMIKFTSELGLALRLGSAVIQVNRDVVSRLGELIKSRRPAPSRVAVLGLSYKAGTHVAEESQSRELVLDLAQAGHEVRVYDASGCGEAAAVLPSLACFNDPYQAVSGAAAVALMTDCPELRDMDWDNVARLAPGALVVDCWRIAPAAAQKGLEYAPLGLGPGTVTGDRQDWER